MIGLWLAWGCTPAPAPDLVRRVSIESVGERLDAEAPVLLNVWALWCAPCLEELPRLEAWAAARADVQVLLLNVDVGATAAPRVQRHVADAGWTHAEVWQLDAPDPTLSLRAVIPGFGGALPVTVLAREGAIVHRFDRAVTDADLAGLP